MTLPDADSISTYGGPYANYGIGPVDPTTDLDANLFNKVIANVAMASRMADRCEVAIKTNSWNGATGTVSAWEAVWKGVSTTPPTVVHTATGTWTVTWPATVQDELLATHTVNLTSAFGAAQGTTALHVQAQASANVITFYVFSATGTLTDIASTVIRLRAR